MAEVVVVVLNGWGSSSRRRETRTATMAREVTKGHVAEGRFLGLRAMLGWSRSRRVRRFILRHQNPHRSLLLVGKSLGARNMVSRVLNRMATPLGYRRVGLVTIDPCWPTRWDLTPNLNRAVLKLTATVDQATNFMAVLPQDQQAGAMVHGPRVVNVPLSGPDHFTIVQAPEVRAELERMALELVTP